MNVVRAISAVLLSLTLCQAQHTVGAGGAPDEAYTRRLVRLLTGLQKNPWRGWKAGTVVVVREVRELDPASKAPAEVLPDMVYQVLEADKLFIRTRTLKGKPFRQDFLVKDQVGLEAASLSAADAVNAELGLDGFVLPGRLSVSVLHEYPSGSITTKEWSLVSHPSILLRLEVNGDGWSVTSARATRRIGEREFPCVEIKKRMSAYHRRGRMDVLTTQYLSPDVPGHLVEEVGEFFKVEKGRAETTPFMVVRQKVVDLKVQ